MNLHADGAHERRRQLSPIPKHAASQVGRLLLADALREAPIGGDLHARRREIVFAVCFAESYLFEWVRDQVLGGDFHRLAIYLPSGDKRGIRQRWKEVVKRLRDEQIIPASPDFGLPYWEHFDQLVDYRDGLVHAGASRPTSSARPMQEGAVPSVEALQTMPRGWPVRVVVELVRRLHAAVGSATPAWLVEP